MLFFFKSECQGGYPKAKRLKDISHWRKNLATAQKMTLAIFGCFNESLIAIQESKSHWKRLYDAFELCGDGFYSIELSTLSPAKTSSVKCDAADLIGTPRELGDSNNE